MKIETYVHFFSHTIEIMKKKEDETKHNLYKPDCENHLILRFISKKLSIR